MKKNIFLLLSVFCFFPTFGFAQNSASNSFQNNDIIANIKSLTPQQIWDTANYYHDKNNFEKALAYYHFIVSSPTKNTDVEQQKRIIRAYNKAANIYASLCDYYSAYDFYIKALTLCEKINYDSLKSGIYNNIGIVFVRFKKFDMAKTYYTMAQNLCQEEKLEVLVLNNMGLIEAENNKIDSAFHYFRKSLEIGRQHNNVNISYALGNIALLYKEKKLYDSAFYYTQLLYNEIKKNNLLEGEADYFSVLGNLYFDLNNSDSALYYLDLSNTIAKENSFFRILTENYLTLSKIEEKKGRIKSAFEYYKNYANLKDSIFNAKNFGDINQLQRLYEVSKTNQQIEQFIIEQQVNERTIFFQRIMWMITTCILLLASAGLVYIYLQKRKLNVAYKILFEKNIEIMEYQQISSESVRAGIKKNVFTQNVKNELIEKILNVMENTALICDPEFSIDKLILLTDSNYKYVSQAINNVLNKNFRVLLNSYRIREAQRLFSAPDAKKYTTESVALQVGFKSYSTFWNAFKEITGLNPNFYLKSVQKKGV